MQLPVSDCEHFRDRYIYIGIDIVHIYVCKQYMYTIHMLCSDTPCFQSTMGPLEDRKMSFELELAIDHRCGSHLLSGFLGWVKNIL